MTVLTYGTFDVFHYGHYNLLKRAKEMGDRLIVGVSSDAMAREKGKTTTLSEEKRMSVVADLRFVDEVIPEENMAQKVSDAQKYHADIFVLGDDYAEAFKKMPEYEQLLALGVKVCFLPRTRDISSTALKEKIKDNTLKIE